MNKDLCIDYDGGVVNIRVGAIILKDGKFLMVSHPAVDYLYSVGGRIRFGETADQFLTDFNASYFSSLERCSEYSACFYNTDTVRNNHFRRIDDFK